MGIQAQRGRVAEAILVMNPLNWQPATSLPGYYTQKELLAALGMSRQNFHQSGLAEVIRPAASIGRNKLYSANDVKLWRYWLYCRKGWIALGVYPADKELVPEGGKVPWWVEVDEYGWVCPTPGCRKTAISAPDPDDPRVWCGEHGIQALPPSSGGTQNVY